MEQILVFKTSVKSYQDMRAVKRLLNKLLDKTEKWNFDLEDCDRILRVEAEFVEAGSIIKNFARAGVYCRELE